MARSDDGQWRAIGGELGHVPLAFASELWSEDVAQILELDTPAPIIAVRPQLAGSPDALAVTANGGVLVIMVVGDEDPAAITKRLVSVVEGIRTLEFVCLVSASNRIGWDHTPGSFLAERGFGDPLEIDAALATTLERDACSVVVIARCGINAVAASIVEAETIACAVVDSFDLVLLGSGDAPLMVCDEVPRSELVAAAASGTRVAEAAHFRNAVERNFEAHDVDLLRTLQGFTEAFFESAAYMELGETVVLRAWLDKGAREFPALQLDSAGWLKIRLRHFRSWNRSAFVHDLGRITDRDFDDHGGPNATVQLLVPRDLSDISLVEQFVGAVGDALLTSIGDDLARAAA